ncbi:hypothetical protein QBC32DRAFT_207479, partial [Pseudoneurospora amorphoporcata]
RPCRCNFPRPGDLPRHPSGGENRCHWLPFNWPLGTLVTNHWADWTNGGNASPCFGFVSDLPAESRGRLLSGVGRTVFMDTLPTLSDPRLFHLHVPSQKVRDFDLHEPKANTRQSKKMETITSHKERNYVTRIPKPSPVTDRPRRPDRDTQKRNGHICMEPQTMTTKKTSPGPNEVHI